MWEICVHQGGAPLKAGTRFGDLLMRLTHLMTVKTEEWGLCIPMQQILSHGKVTSYTYLNKKG